jgi:hypothetical protein
MSSVRNCVLLGNPRIRGTALIASAVLFAAACHSGVETPVSPSIEGLSVPTASSTALAGGPIDFTMAQNTESARGPLNSGFSGTCTVGTGGEGFRVRATGQGVPGQYFYFVLKPTDPDQSWRRYTDVGQVDDRGNFRTGWGLRVTDYLPSGTNVYCALLPRPGTGELAWGPPFDIP